MLPRPAPWARDYVGIPFAAHGRDRAGVDCWGLVRLVLAEQFRLFLPSFAEAYGGIEDRAAIAAAIAGQREEWRRISGPFLHDGDVVLMRLGGVAMHVGVVAGSPWVLHAEAGTDSAVDRLDGLRWRGRLDSVWRHPRMAG